MCDEVSHLCVECTQDGECPDAAAPQCDGHQCKGCTSHDACDGRAEGELCETRGTSAVKGQCVQCLSHADCENPTPQCNANGECVPCTSSAACEGREGTLECNTRPDVETTGRCVRCTGATEATRCGVRACNQRTGTCTGTNLGSSTECEACEADSECGDGTKCLTQEVGGKTYGPYCFFATAANGGCADTVLAVRPYSVTTPATTTSIDGTVAEYCLPITTCAAVLHATGTRKACVVNDSCGETGVPDGLCHDLGGAQNECTYNCRDDGNPGNGLGRNYDCPAGLECKGTEPGLYCQP